MGVSIIWEPLPTKRVQRRIDVGSRSLFVEELREAFGHEPWTFILGTHVAALTNILLDCGHPEDYLKLLRILRDNPDGITVTTEY